MLPRIWLAVVLGVILGAGVAYTSVAPVVLPPTVQPETQAFQVQRNTAQTTGPNQSQPQLALLALLAGAIVATPVLLITRRNR